jgi:hypothetical protein
MKKSAPHTTDTSRSEFTELEQLPNVGPAVAADLRRLGVARPQDLPNAIRMPCTTNCAG